jgi:hypothetical protein
MNSVNITITDLTFPDKLEDKYCKFRPVVSLRYKDSNDKTTYAREVLPGLGKRDYWECEKDNKNKDGYVRHDTLPKVDMENKLDISKREITFDDLDIKTFDRIEVEIFDIDIKVGWEVTVSKLATLIPADALTLLNPALPPTLMLVKAAVEKATGKNVKDLEKGLISKLVGKEDGAARSIFARSQTLTNPPQTSVTLAGPGTQGNYSVSLEIEVD